MLFPYIYIHFDYWMFYFHLHDYLCLTSFQTEEFRAVQRAVHLETEAERWAETAPISDDRTERILLMTYIKLMKQKMVVWHGSTNKQPWWFFIGFFCGYN